MATIVINRFDGGKAQDPRTTSSNEFSVAKHFDIKTFPHKLVPLVDMEDDSQSITDNTLSSFIRLEYTPGTTNIFALGRKSAVSANFKFFEKVTPNDFTSTWSPCTTGEGSSGTVILNSLVGFNSNLIALWKNSSDVIVTQYARSSNTLTETKGTIANGASGYTGTVYPRPYFHTKDGILYFGAYNKLAKLTSGGTFTDISASSSLLLPPNYLITSITEFGNYLAIGAREVNLLGNSRVFLWDRDTSQTTFTETIDWGDGSLNVLENIDGNLIGISEISSSSAFRKNPRIVIKLYNGGQPTIIKEIPLSSSGSLSNLKEKSNNQIYFTANISSGLQVYVVGKNQLGQWYVSEANLANNDTVVTAINGIGVLGDIVWVQYDAAGALKRTNDAASYTASSTYETSINPSMPIDDLHRLKKLVAVSLLFDPLVSGNQAVLKYRVDGGSWVTILTETSIGKVTTEATASANGSQFEPGREYEFQAISTGGAKITGIVYRYIFEETLL